MEECLPGGDYASGEGDPSRSDNPPVIWTTNPAGEQAQGSAQGENVSRGDAVSQPASHSPQSKRKKDSSATPASQVLKKHEDEFFDMVNPKLNLLWLKRKAVISEGLIAKIQTADTRDAKEILFEHLHRNADVAALREYCKMAVAADGFPKMQKLGEKMQNELTLEGMAMAVNPLPDVPALNLESYKSDIVSCDLSVFESQKRPAEAIRSLYFNAYNHLIRILSPHCSAIKSVALSAVRTKQVSATEVKVKGACDLRALFECLEVDRKWNNLHFLDVAIMSLPMEASKEKAAAQLVLSQYKSYLTHYTKAVSIKKGKSVRGFLQRKRSREGKMVVTEITIDKEIDEYTCHDLLGLWKLFLIETLEIPEDRIEYRLARSGNSTTLVFMIAQTYAEGIKKKLSKPAAVWVMKELDILRVYVAGMVSTDLRDVLANVLIASIREGLKSGADFVSLTKFIPPLICSLLDQVPEPKETQPGNIQPYYAGLAEQSVPEPAVEAASSASVVKDLLVAAAEGRLHEVQSLLDGGRCRVNDEDEEGYTAILESALNGRLTVLRTLVEQYGGNVLHREKGGRNAFLLCSEGGHLAVAEYFAPKMEGHLFDSDDDGHTALHLAAYFGQLSTVEYLVRSCGFDVKAIDKNGFNALHLSAERGHVGVAQYLAPEMGFHMFDLTDEKDTALHRAAMNGHFPMVEHLVKSAGFDVKDKNKNGVTPFLIAAAMGHVEVAAFLLDNGSGILERADGGFNAFHLSAERGHVGVAQYLAPMMGVHMFDLTDAKETALHRAAKKGNMPMVEHLVKSVAFDVKDKNKYGETPFLAAAASDHVEVAGFLLDNGSSILERDDGGRNAFLLCAMKGHLAVAEYLAPKMEGHLFDSDDDGHTALHLAACFGQLPMVEYLVRSCGFDVKAIDKEGNTPLLLAAWKGHAGVAQFLLARGSSVQEQNNDGCNAFDACAVGGHLAIAEYLVPKMEGHLFDSDGDGYTALHWASYQGHLSMVQYLVRSCGFDVKARDKWGYTPLLRAVVKGHADIARFLLASGSVFNERNSDGESALQIAVRRGHLDVVKLLVQVYRDCHMESEIDQYYMDLADDYNHEHVVGYLSSEFPSLKRKVPVLQPRPTRYPNVWSISGPTYPDY